MDERSNSAPMAALLGGLAGAATLNLIHETARRILPEAPRMDTLGRRALARGLEAAGIGPPPRDELQAITLAGDLVANAIDYALVGVGSPTRPVLRGALLGAAAGVGAVVLPPHLGLGRRPRGVTPEVKAMTVAWYVAGGLAAGAAYRLLRDRRAAGAGGPVPLPSGRAAEADPRVPR